MAFLSLLVVLIVLNIIYVIGFLGAQVLRAAPQHYFLGFDPDFLTFRVRNVKFTFGIYIPIIGLSRIFYVDHDGKKQLFYPWKFAKVPVFQRLLLTYSGVMTLFVFGVLLAVTLAYTSKEKYVSKDEVNKYGIYPSPQARIAGFLPGDKVIAVNGKDYTDYMELVHPKIVYSDHTTYTVLREGKELMLSLRDTTGQYLPSHELFLTVNAPFAVRDVLPGSPAAKAGILSGDKIVKVNDHPITSFQEMNSWVKADEDGEVDLDIRRGNNPEQKFERTIVINRYQKIGISIDQKIEYKTKEHSLSESFEIGVARVWSGIVVQLKVLGIILGPYSAKKTVSGPVGISAPFGDLTFRGLVPLIVLYITYVIVLNFLPLPKSAILEVIPLGYEIVKRKPLSYKSFRMIRKISIWLLVVLMVWQFVSDIAKLL